MPECVRLVGDRIVPRCSLVPSRPYTLPARKVGSLEREVRPGATGRAAGSPGSLWLRLSSDRCLQHDSLSFPSWKLRTLLTLYSDGLDVRAFHDTGPLRVWLWAQGQSPSRRHGDVTPPRRGLTGFWPHWLLRARRRSGCSPGGVGSGKRWRRGPGPAGPRAEGVSAHVGNSSGGKPSPDSWP